MAVAPWADMSQEALQQLVDANKCTHLPFFVGKAKSVDEVFIMYQAPEADKHKPKTLVGLSGAYLLTFKKAGGMSQKVIQTVEQAFKATSAYLTNLRIQRPPQP